MSGGAGGLLFSAPTHPFRSREREVRKIHARSSFLEPFGRASTKNSSGLGAEALPNGP
jgi:hypothetical protein